jgi:hypothetical protein
MILSMPAPLNTVRLVVQRVPSDQWVSYRIIVYPAREGFKTPISVSSPGELMKRLSGIIPDFDKRALAIEDKSPKIIFAETLELSDAQLGLLKG